MIDLTLPLPPTINHYYLTKGKKRFLSSEAKAFRLLVLTARARAGAPKISGRLSLTATMHMRSKARADLDNRIKSLQDALIWAGFFEDDEQIDRLVIVRGEVIRGGLCRVLIERIGE